METGRTLWELVERRAAVSPDAPMIEEDTGRSMTFVAYRDLCERVAAGFHDRGVRPGTVVSWQLPTWLEAMVLLGALSRLGAVQNPIIPIYRAREVGFVTRQAGTSMLVTPSLWKGTDFEAMAREVAERVGGIEIVVCNRGSLESGVDLPTGDPAVLEPVPEPPSDPSELPVRWLYYTSGTTADPKGARHSDMAALVSGMTMVDGLGLSSADVVPLVFPIAHIGGVGWLVGVLASGCRIVLMEGFDARTSIPLMARIGATVGPAGTAHHLMYLAAQREHPDVPLFPTMRIFTGGGAPKPPQIYYDLVAEMGAPVMSSFGMTECPIITFTSLSDPDEKLATTEGRARGGAEVRIVTLDGRPAAPGEEGELRVRGPQLMRGYIDEALNADAFDDEGWLRTGDLGRLDVDGYLTISGRLKDIIIRKGENISAKELEDLLYEHPRIGDVAVIGLPDARSGERVCAVVAMREGAEPLTMAEMGAFLREHDLMVQKLPEQLEIVDAVPRNPSGKILKAELRKRFTV
jgi:cyclohexanecarboxylate-CoA ligase